MILKPGISIEGFDTEDQAIDFFEGKILDAETPTYYAGLTAEIPEEVAKKYVMDLFGGANYFDYSRPNDGTYAPGYILDTARESVQSACYREYCVIYKSNSI